METSELCSFYIKDQRQLEFPKFKESKKWQEPLFLKQEQRALLLPLLTFLKSLVVRFYSIIGDLVISQTEIAFFAFHRPEVHAKALY